MPFQQIKQSLTRTTIIKMGVRIAFIIIAVTLVSYWHIMSNLKSQVVEQLDKYISERGKYESTLFLLAKDNHLELKKELLWQLEKLGEQDPKAEFDRLFVRTPDGVIRNRPEIFDGTRQAGVYVDETLTIDADIRRRVLTFYKLATLYGKVWHNRFQDTGIFAPENIEAVYWPEYPTWVQEATTDLYIPDEEWGWIADKKHNPEREFVCTGLFYEKISKIWMISCDTPIDIADKHIATVVNDIFLNELFERTIANHIEGTHNIIFREDGRLIVHPQHMNQIMDASGEFDLLKSDDKHLSDIFQSVTNRPDDKVVIENDNEYLAVTKIEGPDWYFVTVYPKSLLTKLAFDTASFILVLGILSLLIEITVLFVVLRKQVAKPLNHLINATEHITKGHFDIQLDMKRQDELGRLANSFNTMSDEIQAREKSLREANKLKDEFLANTSHELRTPLNGIIGIAESLIDGATGELNKRTSSNLAMIATSGKRLSSLVDDILDFSKLKHHDLGLQLKPLELHSIVDMVLTLSQPLIAQKEITFVNKVKLDLLSVFADENRLQQILHNLIGNAIKFTEQGYITISAQAINEQQIQITIADEGIGIHADKLDRIFESFEQAEGFTARKYGGTGLGLAVTKKLVELHGGKIQVESVLGIGSKFIFTLPSSQESAVPISAQPPKLSKIVTHTDITELNEENDTESLTTTTFKVLIVDDEPVNLQVLHNHLSLQNYNIIQATSGIEALKFIDDGFIPDVILLDVMMPQMTGYEVTNQLRKKWQAVEMPILLLTAKNQVEDLVQGLDAGANDYMVKPISKEELLARIKTHLSLKTLTADNLRMGAELDVAKHLQQLVLPKEAELQQIDNLDIAGFMEPADEIGGDYYEVLNHDGHIKIGIGDVTGHGLESGVLMLMVQTTVRALLLAGIDNPEQFLNIINRTIYHNAKRMETDKNLTLSLLDYQNGTLQLTGQHEEVLLVRKNGEIELIDTLKLGFSVGMLADITKFTSHQEITLQPGDGIVLFTDGITEAQNFEEQQYGLERLCNIVSNNWLGSSLEVQQAVIADVKDYIGKQKVIDDITLLVLKQK
ncbi:SpoIIE family protein phosphatase [Candidatus Halobeggiatoa sp. HSG11]|nr:SpoIIE family protein phosphatase [Candidatus Halobeggiatoa sp. HSG11]